MKKTIRSETIGKMGKDEHPTKAKKAMDDIKWITKIDDPGVGQVKVFPGFLTPEESIKYFHHFAGPNQRRIRPPQSASLDEFKVDGVTFNKKFPLGTMHRGQKLIVAHQRKEGYGYSGTSVEGHLMEEEERHLLNRINEATNTEANSILINYYRKDIIDIAEDGAHVRVDYLGAHGDNEKELIGGYVVGIAFMEKPEHTRILRFRHKKRKTKIDMEMKGGDLYVMQGRKFQTEWTHEVPRTKNKPAIISVTTRQFRE